MMLGVLSLHPVEPVPVKASEEEPVVLDVVSGGIVIADELGSQSTWNAGQSLTVDVPVTLTARAGDAMVEVRPAAENDDEEDED